MKNELDEAIRYYGQALTVKPESAEANYNLGAVLQEKGQIDDAVMHYRRAIELNPDFDLPKRQLRQLGTAGRPLSGTWHSVTLLPE